MANDLTWPLARTAKLMDLSARRLQQLTAEGIIPREARGRYNPIKANVAYVRFLRDRKPEEKDANANSIHLLREDQRAEIRLNMEIKRRTRIPIDDVEDIAGKYFDLIAGAVKARKGRTVTDETIEDVFSEIRDATRDLSSKIKEDGSP